MGTELSLFLAVVIMCISIPFFLLGDWFAVGFCWFLILLLAYKAGNFRNEKYIRIGKQSELDKLLEYKTDVEENIRFWKKYIPYLKQQLNNAQEGIDENEKFLMELITDIERERVKNVN